jgi:hypothetical protein
MVDIMPTLRGDEQFTYEAMTMQKWIDTPDIPLSPIL